MNPSEKQQLRKLLSDSDDYVDNTEGIRKERNSLRIIEGLSKLEKLKKTHAALRADNPDEFAELCRSECLFMFTNYTDIFNKQLKDELNLGIMIRMVKVLEMIENGDVDQSEGSVIVGKFLKELYVDSALRRADNLDKANETDEVELPKELPKEISWEEYKRMK